MPKSSKSDSTRQTLPTKSSRKWSVCFHESGHVVVAHAQGRTVDWVEADERGGAANCNRDKPQQRPFPDPVLANMIFDCGGDVACAIYQARKSSRGPLPESTYTTTLISERFGSGMLRDDYWSVSDYMRVVSSAWRRCELRVTKSRHAKQITHRDFLLKMHQLQTTAHCEDVRAEILVAEQAARIILTRYWLAVRDVATALYRSDSGYLYRKEILRLLNRYFEPDVTA